jgi:hypothetical protein
MYVTRDLLACLSFKVNIKYFFFRYRDKYGIRRHVLKAKTVRVITLLLSWSLSQSVSHQSTKQSRLTDLPIFTR